MNVEKGPHIIMDVLLFLVKLHTVLVFFMFFFNAGAVVEFLPSIAIFLGLAAGLFNLVYAPAKRSADHKIAVFRFGQIMSRAEKLPRDMVLGTVNALTCPLRC